jgi:hypothetical protein
MAYPYDNGGYSALTPSDFISTPSSSYSVTVPSSLTTTKVLTNSTTITNYFTSTTVSPYPPKDIISPIKDLAECSVSCLQLRLPYESLLTTPQQSILFECLANSKCNPADFACNCEELKTLAIESKIGETCSAADKAQYIAFQDNVCRGVFPTPSSPVSPSSIIVTLSASSKPVSTPVIPIAIYNTTVTANDTTTTIPVKITTTKTLLLTTTDKAGKPTTIETVLPEPGYPTVPVVPAPAPVPSEYTGAAGSMKMAALAGTVGFLGLVFAGL